MVRLEPVTIAHANGRALLAVLLTAWAQSVLEIPEQPRND
jgi:hypothetical protein